MLKLLSANVLASCIQKIESQCPGWVWSISQYPGEIIFHLSPGRKGTWRPDYTLALTDEGDNGWDITFCYSNEEAKLCFAMVHELNAVEALSSLISGLDKLRNLTPVIRESFPKNITNPMPYRHQTPEMIDTLLRQYNALTVVVDESHPQRCTVNNIYLGSCDLTIDCSIRGTWPDGSEFDFSHDEPDIVSLGYSIKEANVEWLEALDTWEKDHANLRHSSHS